MRWGWWGLQRGWLERVMWRGLGERALAGKGLWPGREIHIDWVLIWWRALFNPCTKLHPSPFIQIPHSPTHLPPPPSCPDESEELRSWGGLRGWSEPADRSKLNSAGLLFVFTLWVCVCVCVCVFQSAEQNNPYVASHVPAPLEGFYKNTINQCLLSQVV